MAGITLIGFDADDTLWQNEQFYRLTEERFIGLLDTHADPENLSQRLLEAERRNLSLYGFGIKGFILSMVETAIEVTQGRLPTPVIGNILDVGREMLRHPIESLPYAEETLRTLAESHRLVLITKGDLFDQERKLAQSGLGDYFDAVEIVSDKTPEVYRRIFERHGDGPRASMMVGNSVKSDVAPVIAIGGWAVHVPHELTWTLEQADPPTASPRFRRIAHLGELPALLLTVGH